MKSTALSVFNPVEMMLSYQQWASRQYVYTSDPAPPSSKTIIIALKPFSNNEIDVTRRDPLSTSHKISWAYDSALAHTLTHTHTHTHTHGAIGVFY